ncbi:ShlB/FhaC/HecB family hemolysin secretion/activation protein [Falsiroseomonas sp. HC035]|uniref:ShlB/FhaC/HecB family hemolysin secretion/activation protein n=1 Tax=Falsiroseomonas sp. HC035 TaxID=3390999 RepID=UPI003D31CFDA
MRSTHGIVILLLLGSQQAAAQAVPPLTPDRLQQLAPTQAPRLAPALQAPIPDPIRGPNEQLRIRVSGVQPSGNTVLPDAEVTAAFLPLVGQEVTLEAIERARVDTIAAYGRRGYPFVSAVAGLRPVEGGNEILLAMVEGRVASVKLDNDIGPAGTQVLRFLENLLGSGPLTTGQLERALLLAGDVPGVSVRSVVRPLADGGPGELELVAQVTRRAFSGYVYVDNRGYNLTGPLQGILSVGANSFTSTGERIEATIFQTQDWEQSFGQLSGETFIGASGLRMRLYAGAGVSRPGSFLAQIGYQGNTEVAGISAQYPIIRSRPLNLSASAAFDYLNSEIEAGGGRQSLDEVRALRFGLDGSARDTLVPFTPGPAINTANVRLHRGVAWLGATGNGEVPGPGRVESDFGFQKWTGEASRTQPLLAPTDGLVISVAGLVAGQHSSDVLPLAEKFLFGGNRLGRGFYAGQVTGDSALGASLELLFDVRPAPFLIPGLQSEPVEVQPTAQFYLFRDFGRTWENLRTDAGRTVESWGGGVRMFLTETVQLDVEGVRRMTRRVDAAGGSVRPLDETAGYFRLLTRF